MKKKKVLFGLNTVRKKVLLLSKLVGGIIVLFYLVTLELPAERNISFWIWFVLMAAVIIGVDFVLGRMISKPLEEINHKAGRMAELDFSETCHVNTNDEFGELSYSLNVLSGNLESALESLAAANAQLEEDVEREHLLLEQRKELADRLSHEMKTPLGLIRAYTEGMKEETDEAKKQEYMDAVLSAADRMNSMIVSLLDLSALEAGAVKFSEEVFDFVELAETAAGRMLLNVPEPWYDFQYELPDVKVYVLADQVRIEQVLVNLIENAKKHVRKNGVIKLGIHCNDNGHVRFSLFNEGETIPEPELPLIWDKFYKGKNTGGSGLGLAIVAQILSVYHAPCQVVNHAGGVEFSFDFPIVSEYAEAPSRR